MLRGSNNAYRNRTRQLTWVCSINQQIKNSVNASSPANTDETLVASGDFEAKTTRHSVPKFELRVYHRII